VRSGSGTASELLKTIFYGTRSPRLTLISGVVFVIATAPPSTGSSAMWLLKSWLVPGDDVASSVRCSW